MQKFVTVVLLLWLFPVSALAQQQCSVNTVQPNVDRCKTALSSINANVPSNVQSDSLASASAIQSVASGNQSAALQDALDYCQVRKSMCQYNCSTPLRNRGTIQGLPVMDVPESTPLEAQCNSIVGRGRLPSSVQCQSASPLVIQMGETPIELTAPQSGVLFDLLGHYAKPDHKPVQISWLNKNSLSGNYFLTLPDDQGRVLGIDQLFGNDTYGPDQKNAPDGFAALGKYDGRLADGIYDESLVDGQIDSRDPVFARLRLWHDLNGDGMAQANELVTLDDLGVISIDLRPVYFYEVDEFGNSLRSRSVVTLLDQTSRVMFDLWFAL